MRRFATRCYRALNFRLTKNVQSVRTVHRPAFKQELAPIFPRIRSESTRNFMLLLTAVFAASMDDQEETAPIYKSPFDSENVMPIQKVSDLDDIVAEAGEKLVVIFCMVRWCPFCRRIAPIVDEIAAKRAGDLVMLKLDMDDQEADTTKIMTRYEAFYDQNGRPAVGLPTFVFLRYGTKLEHFSSADDKRLRGAVKKYTI